ncbi:WD40-repeat-containing domain protein [Pelagophyceae sp. CCMP2097]|nr:WD40-repeat-containing domain protein [Pelagophyceae sp. CCMP2097]
MGWVRAPDVALGANEAPSLASGNLSAAASKTLLAYCHRDEATLLDLSDGSRKSVPFRIKPTKIFEVKLCTCHGVLVLVVATLGGVQLWQVGSTMRHLLCHALTNGDAESTSVFARGIAATQRGMNVCVGCSTGALLVFDTSESDVDVRLARSAQAHGCPIAAVACAPAGADVVATADERGEVRLWDLPALTPSPSCAGGVLALRTANDALTCLALPTARLAVAGFASGHVRVYAAASGVGGLLAELQAHTRCITALDVSVDGRTFATVGEDSYVHVWALDARGLASDGEDKGQEVKSEPAVLISRDFSESVDDALLTGVQFLVHGAGNAHLSASAYDHEAIKLWAKV